MRKDFGSKTWFYPMPVLIIGSYNEDGNLIGQIVNISADERVLGIDGLIDPAKLQAIAYDAVHNDYLLVSEKVGNAFQDSAEIEP